MSKVCVATDSHKVLLVGNSTRVEALLKPSSRADMDARDTRGYTPFMVACAGGHVDVVRVLCAAGCDCTLRNDVGLVSLPHTRADAYQCALPSSAQSRRSFLDTISTMKMS